jgi:tetratricopeptide (TPR) repeat protein
MDDYVNAVRDYQSAIKLDPSYALAYYNAGNVYFKQRQFKQVNSTITVNQLFYMYWIRGWKLLRD